MNSCLPTWAGRQETANKNQARTDSTGPSAPQHPSISHHTHACAHTLTHTSNKPRRPSLRALRSRTPRCDTCSVHRRYYWLINHLNLDIAVQAVNTPGLASASNSGALTVAGPLQSRIHHLHRTRLLDAQSGGISYTLVVHLSQDPRYPGKKLDPHNV